MLLAPFRSSAAGGLKAKFRSELVPRLSQKHIYGIGSRHEGYQTWGKAPEVQMLGGGASGPGTQGSGLETPVFGTQCCGLTFPYQSSK